MHDMHGHLAAPALICPAAQPCSVRTGGPLILLYGCKSAEVQTLRCDMKLDSQEVSIACESWWQERGGKIRSRMHTQFTRAHYGSLLAA